MLEANRVLLEAYESDVRPLLVEARKRMGLDPDPIASLRRSGYAEEVRCLAEGRELVRRSVGLERYEPTSADGWDSAWERFQSIRLAGAERRLA